MAGSSGFELRMQFYGLTSPVPLNDDATDWLVVLPDLREGAHVFEGTETGEKSAEPVFSVRPHQPVLVVARESILRRPKRRAGLEFTPSRAVQGSPLQPGKPYVLYEFDGELLSLGTGRPKAVKSKLAAIGKPSPADKGEERDLRWVPPLEMVLPEAKVFDRRFLREDGDQFWPGEGIVGLVRLDRGSLHSIDVFRDETGEPAVYEFRPLGGGTGAQSLHLQAIAVGFELCHACESKSYALQWTGRAGGRDLLRLRPHGGEVEAYVFNRELDRVLGYPGTDFAGADCDFAYLYRFSTEWPRLESKVVNLPVPVLASGIRGANKTCEPPRFASLSG